MHLTIFKTNVITQEQSFNIQLLLNDLPLVTHCNFDLDDCDRILRIITTELQPDMICHLLHSKGFHCETMETFIYSFD